MSIVVNDEFLYKYMPRAEQAMLDRIPPENELHHRFSRRFRRKMRALLRYERQTPKIRKLVHRCKVAAAMFAVAGFMTFGALMSVEACRTRIIEVITRVFEEFTSVQISADEGITDKVLRPIAPTYVPEGYQLKEEIANDIDYMIIYEDQSESALIYRQEFLVTGVHIFDTEDADIEKILIDSQEIQLIFNKGFYQIYWCDNYYFYSLIGKVEKNKILEMAESIIEQ